MFCLACRVFSFYYSLFYYVKFCQTYIKVEKNPFLHNNNAVIISIKINNNSLVLSEIHSMFNFFPIVSKMSFKVALFKSGSNKVHSLHLASKSSSI